MVKEQGRERWRMSVHRIYIDYSLPNLRAVCKYLFKKSEKFSEGIPEKWNHRV